MVNCLQRVITKSVQLTIFVVERPINYMVATIVKVQFIIFDLADNFSLVECCIFHHVIAGGQFDTDVLAVDAPLFVLAFVSDCPVAVVFFSRSRPDAVYQCALKF
jgi:hypothetical protein